MNKHDHRNDDDHDDLLREEGRQFDVIFGDLTDIPVHGNDTSTWNFVRSEKNLPIIVSTASALSIGF